MAECRRPDCGRAHPSDDPLCSGCLEEAQRSIAQLARDHVDLGTHIAASSRSGGSAHGAPGPRIPLDLAVDELQRRIWWLATCWHDVLVDRVNGRAHAWSRSVRQGVAVRWAVIDLVRGAHQLARVTGVELWSYPQASEQVVTLDGWQGLLDLAVCHADAVRLCGLTDPAPERIPAVPCPRCDMAALVREFDQVRCLSCRERVDLERYTRWTKQLAAVNRPADRHGVSRVSR